MRNVEFKAELRDPALARAVCKAVGASLVVTMEQVDTYYRVVRGRLKKRESTVLDIGGPGVEPVEYIFYERADRVKPAVSAFTIYGESEVHEHFGQTLPPVWLVVRKKRSLYMLGATRIHLDEVEDLGWFIEFESLVSRTNNTAKALAANKKLRAAFHMTLGEPISRSYSDMIALELETDLGMGRDGETERRRDEVL